MPPVRLGFIGTGQMARALARGISDARLVPAHSIVGHDVAESAAEQFASAVPGARVVASNAAVLAEAETVFLAIKPQSLREVCAELPPPGDSSRLWVSVLAGVRLKTLCESLGSPRVIRVMPNTPCLVRCGVSAYALGPGASAEDGQQVATLLGSVGLTLELEEKLLDAVTGLSGSGPAYVFTIIEALSDGGVRAGLPRAIAARLAAQTVFGAAQMLLATGEHPAVLRDRVTSPGGTTIAGLQVLEQRGLRAALIDAVEAAARRSSELGNTC